MTYTRQDVWLSIDPASQLVTVDDPTPTVSVEWDRVVQLCVIDTSPGPTVASRAYAMMHTAMYDAWAATDRVADGVHFGGRVRLGEEATDDAMAVAARTVLAELFPEQAAIFDAQLEARGLSPDAGGRAAELGRAAGRAVLDARRDDGSNQANGYAPVNENGDPLYTPVNESPEAIEDIARWTPESVPIDPEDASPEQSFLTPQWASVDPFALESPEALRPVAPEPFFLVDGASLDIAGRTITLADGTVLPVSRDLIGTVINPAFIEQSEQVVEASANLTDREKLIAEFWEDGGATSFPPGTFMTFGQFVSARDDHSQAEDARMFLALSNAVFDAGIATWEAKVHYDYARPVRVIRELGDLGLIGEYDEALGGYAIDAWGGPGQGTQRILATDFVTYQTPSRDPSPPFAEYTSGHSSFSASGAEILRLFSMSDSFGGSVDFEANSSRFEPETTPGNRITLAWDTFTAAADEAGLSRIYGGIHFEDGDLNGRSLGRDVAREVFEKSLGLAQGIGDGAGDDRLRGTHGDDLMAGLGGDDVIRTGRGSDGVVFMRGHGNDRVRDFDVDRGGERHHDTLLLSGFGDLDGEYGTRAELRALIEAIESDGDGRTDAVVGGRDVTFVLGDDQITLEGVARSLGGRRDLLELGADNARFNGTNLDDTLRGSRGGERYEGGRGDDVIRTGRGRDEVVMREGDGHDRVRDFDVNGGRERSFDTLSLEGYGAIDGSYSTRDDLLYLVSVLHNDGDQTTGASLRGNHLTLDLGEDSVRLDRVVDDLGRQNLLQAMEDYVLL